MARSKERLRCELVALAHSTRVCEEVWSMNHGYHLWPVGCRAGHSDTSLPFVVLASSRGNRQDGVCGLSPSR